MDEPEVDESLRYIVIAKADIGWYALVVDRDWHVHKKLWNITLTGATLRAKKLLLYGF